MTVEWLDTAIANAEFRPCDAHLRACEPARTVLGVIVLDEMPGLQIVLECVPSERAINYPHFCYI